MIAKLRARSPAAVAVVGVCQAIAVTPVVAQDAAGARRITVGTSLSVRETVTNNLELSAVSPRSAAVTEISPSITVSAHGSRVRGTLNYSLTGVVYSRESARNTTQNSLSAAFTGEAIENHAFVDVNATIGQLAVSAFGTQAAGGGLPNANRSEVSSLTVAPTLKGNLAGVADITARVSANKTSSSSTSQGDSMAQTALLNASGRLAALGWGLSLTRQSSDFTLGRRTRQDSAVGNLTWRNGADLQLSLRAGRESSDVVSGVTQYNDTWGGGVDWQPTSRTRVSVQGDHRYYGNSYSVALTQRMARSVWSYIDSRSSSIDSSAQTPLRVLTIYDLLYANCLRLGGQATACDQSVRSALLAQGISPDAAVPGGFLSAAATLARAQNASVALSGLRTTLTLSAFRSGTRRLDQSSTAVDDLSRAGLLSQFGYSLGISHRLTPADSLTVAASRQRTSDTGGVAGNDLTSATVSWLGSVGRRTMASLSVRRTVFDSDAAPYSESAVLGSLSLRF